MSAIAALLARARATHRVLLRDWFAVSALPFSTVGAANEGGAWIVDAAATARRAYAIADAMLRERSR